MGKDKAKDGDAATSTDASRDHSRDQESRDAALARTIAEAHPQVHQMYFRFYRIYGLSSTREILNPKCTDPVQLL